MTTNHDTMLTTMIMIAKVFLFLNHIVCFFFFLPNLVKMTIFKKKKFNFVVCLFSLII